MNAIHIQLVLAQPQIPNIYDPSDVELISIAIRIGSMVGRYYKYIDVIPVTNLEALKKALHSSAFIAIYLFHWTPTGIMVGGREVSWPDLVSIIRRSNVRHHVVESCFSSNLKRYGLSDERVLTVNSAVDVEVGFYDAMCKTISFVKRDILRRS